MSAHPEPGTPGWVRMHLGSAAYARLRRQVWQTIPATPELREAAALLSAQLQYTEQQRKNRD